MKKTLVAIAALSAISAFAQSSVTLGGTVDVRLAIGNGNTSNSTQLSNNGIASSQFRFIGVEDLGGGLKAGFHLEVGYSPDDGTGAATNSNNQASGAGAGVAGRQGFTFNRRSTLSVLGGFGEVRLGRDYTPHFWNHTFYDPFGTNGVGSSMVLSGAAGGLVTVRASNTIGYLTPNFGGFSGQIQTYFGENPSNTAAPAGSNAGSGTSLRVGYAQGPISVGLAWGRTNTSVSTDTTTTNIGGSYDLGIAKIMALYNKDANTGANDVNGWLIGATAPLGSGTAKLAFSQTDNGNNGVAKLIALGYVYDLSKRSSVYATLGSVNNSNTSRALNGATTTVGGGSTGFDIGVKHSF